MTTELRPYQQDCIGRLRSAYAAARRAPVLALPTGAGKTIVFAAIGAGAVAKGKRVLVLVHRRELVRQASAKLAAAGVRHGIIAAGFAVAPDEAVQVGSVQTLGRRLDALPPCDLVVIDEAHHARAEQWRAIVAARPQARLLGVTATPCRLDGKGLGIVAGGLFDALVIGPGIAELTKQGYLVPARSFAPAKRLELGGVRTRAGDYVTGDLERLVGDGKITGDAVAEYRKRADHRPALAFCISVAHAEDVAEAFRAAGYRAQAAHGGLTARDRDAAVGGLATGEIEVLAACDLVSEGLDVPAVGAVILLRPTKSLVLHMQQVGRGLRPAPGKTELVVLDHVGNTLAHGMPDAERRWSLAGVGKKASEPGAAAASAWRCECGCISGMARRECAACGAARPGAREIGVVPGVLAEVTAEKLARVRSLSYGEMLRSRLSEAELREFARARGYHAWWVKHRLREQENPALTACGAA
ncbi:MAG TPA: DEAD/DEAH box helicase [Acetobacteraceae bacterium]|nr:DEAD/DEAH box helicase [Acetobacteraceae bacterium]